MQLSVSEVAKLLRVSERLIHHWIEKNDIPAYKAQESYFFNQTEVIEWASTRKMDIAKDALKPGPGKVESLPSFLEALELGGVHHKIPGREKSEVLRSVVGILPLPMGYDKDSLWNALIARESLGSTAIGEGVAIPHVRDPVGLSVPKPIAALCFLEQPIAFGALDGQPVKILFTLISTTVRLHLHLLARLSFVLRQGSVRGVLNQAGSPEELFATIAEAESRAAIPAGG